MKNSQQTNNELTVNQILLIIFGIIMFGSMLISCTSTDDFEIGKKQLEQQGYTDIEYTGYNAFCCSKDDQFSTGFKCKDNKGNTIKGCFCSQAFKGITIRFE